jgi:hypothetical protein
LRRRKLPGLADAVTPAGDVPHGGRRCGLRFGGLDGFYVSRLTLKVVTGGPRLALGGLISPTAVDDDPLRDDEPFAGPRRPMDGARAAPAIAIDHSVADGNDEEIARIISL